MQQVTFDAASRGERPAGTALQESTQPTFGTRPPALSMQVQRHLLCTDSTHVRKVARLACKRGLRARHARHPDQTLKVHLLLVLDLRHGAGLDPVDVLGRRRLLVPERRGAQSRAGVARFPQVCPVAQVVRLVLRMRQVRQVVQAQLRAQAGLHSDSGQYAHAGPRTNELTWRSGQLAQCVPASPLRRSQDLGGYASAHCRSQQQRHGQRLRRHCSFGSSLGDSCGYTYPVGHVLRVVLNDKLQVVQPHLEAVLIFLLGKGRQVQWGSSGDACRPPVQ
jgi:hypothetical protein